MLFAQFNLTLFAKSYLLYISPIIFNTSYNNSLLFIDIILSTFKFYYSITEIIL